MKPRNLFLIGRRAHLFNALQQLFSSDQPKPAEPYVIKARTGRWDPDQGPRPPAEIPNPANDDAEGDPPAAA